MDHEVLEPVGAVWPELAAGERLGTGAPAVRSVHVGCGPPQASLEPILGDLGWAVEPVSDVSAACVAIGRTPVDVVIIDTRSGGSTPSELRRLLDVAVERQIAAIVIGDEPSLAAEGSPLVTRVPGNTSLEELRGRLVMIERYHALIRGMERELGTMQQLTDRLKDHFREIDDEMKLASRLQRDFLPDLSEPIQGVQFASIYRPATWVSGDMFDVFRIDEYHTGVYLADAVGHGMAAGLLTMFIKRVIMPKRIHAVGYEVVRPSVVLTLLNDALAEQDLPNCQFVTACYGVIDHRAHTFTFARGGHPHPLHVAADGSVSELITPGGLLGLFAGAEFPEQTVGLAALEKIILVTDGIEHILASEGPEGASFTDQLAKFMGSTLSAPLCRGFEALEGRLDGAGGFHLPQDDLTLLAFEMPDTGDLVNRS